MANIERNFIRGIMNKSIDERLLPAGEYVDALNIRLGSTENSDIGSLENTKGNTQLTDLQYNGTSLSDDARCIGAYEDGANETIYWFIHDSNFAPSPTGKLDLIVSFNVQVNTLTYHVISINDGGSSNTTLNFNPTYLITGVDLVDEKLLFFTDDINPPRCINIDRNYDNPSAGVDGVSAEALLVIKKPPLTSPNVTPQITTTENNFIEDRFICFAYRYRYADGQYSATSQFSPPAFIPSPFDYNYGTGLNDGMLNLAQQAKIEYMSGGPLVVGIDLLWKDMTNGIIRVIEKLDKEKLGLVDNTMYEYTFNNSKIYTVLPSSEILRLYDNVPRLAKAQTVMGGRLFYGNYLEQYDLIDALGQPTSIDYVIDLVSEDIGAESLTETLLEEDYFVDSGNPGYPVSNCRVDIDFAGIDLVAGSSIELTLQFTHHSFTGTVTPTQTTQDTTISLQYVLTQNFNSVDELANSADFRNRIGDISLNGVEPVTNACNGVTFTDDFNCVIPQTLDGLNKTVSNIGIPITPPTSVQGDIAIFSSPTSTVIGLQLLAMRFDDPTNPANYTFEYYEILSADATFQKVASPTSLHSDRSYEVGMIYMDEYGRSTTALVSTENTVYVPCSASDLANHIVVNIPSSQIAPAWATRYKFCIKPDKENYFNVYSRFFFTDPITSDSYFLLEGQNAQKIDEGDILRVKVDSNGTLERCVSATVLEKQSQQEDFITVPDTTVPQGVYMKIKANEFAVSNVENNIIDYGVQSVFGKGCNDVLYPIDVEDSPGVYTDYELPEGTRVRIYINNLREGKGNTSRREWFVDHTFTVTSDYPNFENWFEGENIDIALEALATTDNCTGPAYNPSGIGSCQPGSISSTIMPHPTTGRNSFVVKSSEGQAGTKKRKTKLEVQIVVYRGANFIAFETEPQDALPDVWYESSESYPIVTQSGICQFYLRVNPPEPAPIQFNYIDIDGIEQSVIVPNDGTIVTDGLSPFYGVCSSITTDPSTPPVDPNNIDIITTALPIGTHTGNRFPAFSQANVRTDFFNCYAFGNGIESYVIMDAIGKRDLSLGNRVTSTSAQDYQEVRRYADLTYSGVYNDESNVNKLNEFNLGLLNFKPLEERYGPIYLIDGRETDILTFQEDKISYVLQGKNILTDSTGGGQVASIPEVLGQQVARIEEYGISFHPESFAKWGPYKYFTDAKRGAVLMLTGAGQGESLSVISNIGMRSWFRDLFLESFNTQKLGGYDPYMGEYVLSSNLELLPSIQECIECGISRSFVVDSKESVSFCVDVGFLVGDVSIQYNVLGDGQSAFEVQATYNGVVDTTGEQTSSGALIVDKDTVSENIVNVQIFSQGTTHLEITVNCPAAQELKIIQVCYSLDVDGGQYIHNEYSWVDGTYVSPLHSEQVELASGTSNPLISQYTQITGPQGSGFIPADGATVSIISNKIGSDDYVYNPSTDELRYLRTNTYYANTPAQMQALFNASINATPVVPTNGANTYTAEFTMPSSSDEYLYLIYNYRKPTEIELCYDAASTFAVCCECSDGSLQASFIFDGINQFVEVPDADDLSFGDGVTDQAFSLSTWVYLDSFGSTFNGMIVNKTNEYRIRLTSGGVLLFELLSNPSNRIGRRYNTLAGGDLSTWLNIVCTYDGSKTSAGMKIYINDVQVDNANQNAGTYTGMINTSASLKFMGADYIDGNANHFSVIGKELSAAEVTELYNGGLPIDITTASFASDIVSHWAMDKRDDPTTIVNDIIGTNDGTPFNMSAANLDEVNYPT